MEDLPQAQFNGWAKVEVMGHQSHIGYVKTEAYGSAVLFRIDTPNLPEREYELEEPAYVGGRWTLKGTKIRRLASPGVSVLVGSGSIYRIIPCSEAAAMKAIESSIRSELCEIQIPQIAAGTHEDSDGNEGTDLFEDSIDEDSKQSSTVPGGAEARFFSPSVK